MEENAEKPSPSQSLLQRLKNLREWQEKQQQELLQAHAHTHTPPGPYFTPLKQEAISNFSDSVVKEDSTPPFTLVPIRVEDDHTSAGLPGVGSASVALTHFHIQAKAPESPSEEVDVQPRKSESRDQLPAHGNRAPGKLDLVDRQVDLSSQPDDTDDWQHSPLISTGLSVAHNVLKSPWNDLKECKTSDEKYVRETEHDTEHGTLDTEDTKGMTQSSLHTDASSLPQEGPSDYTDESMEDLFGGEKRAPYRSEKYKSSHALSKECLKVTESSQSVKNLLPTRSLFLSLNKGPDNGPEGMEEIPGPRYKFLKKGEGTSRFGMRPMRLRRPRAEEDKEPSHLPHTVRQGHGEILEMPSSLVSAPLSVFRLPLPILQLERVPQRAASPVVGGRANSMDEQVHGAPNCGTLPESVSSQSTIHPTTQDPVRLPPDPIRELEKQQRKEEAELSAFEKLEELAEDSSFSSNSSTVWHLLKQGQHSISSTPLRTPPPLVLQETPVVGSGNLGAESHSFVGDLINRVLPPSKLSQNQQAAAQVHVKEVLAQLKAIVRLEGHSFSDVSESEIQSFLEGCSSQHPSEALHPTSTPAPPHPPPPLQARPHHVHFNSEGVQVMEYELSDTEGEEDTLTDATSLDSDMITTSDLEALTQFSVKGACVDPQRQGQSHPVRERSICDSISPGEATLKEQEVAQKLQGTVLHFSPPPPRPAQSASNYIWSIFGKERDTKKHTAHKAFPEKATKEVPRKLAPRPQETKRMNKASVLQCGQKEDASQELEVHKTLLLGKVAELERETKLFKKENSKLERLQQQVQEERQKLEKEKCRIQEEAASERKKFQEYVDRERNALWREKQQVIQRPFPVTQPQDDLVVHLREQIRNLQEEAQRKESLNQFTVKKLNDKIKVLENENKKLKERNDSLQALERENQDLRLKVDKTRVGGRTKPPTQPAKPTRGRTKAGIKSTTVDGVTKTLERLSRPQPVIIREAQTNPGKKKQDLANNNLSLEATEDSWDPLAKQGSNAEAPACHESPEHEGTPAAAADEGHTNSLADPPRQTDLSPWAGPGCPEEAGLEHTERMREDGILEVIYANGNRKEIHPSGEVTMSFYNGDRKEIHPDKTVYVYGSDHTSHTTYSNGREELIFPNGQQETRHPDGSSEISFPDGSRKCVLSDGTEICTTKDGSIVRTNPDGSKVFEFPSGQREVHHGGEKRREYPNGTVKIVHPDGRTETRYNSGRIRIKDREGNVILDTHITLASPPPLYS